MARTFLTSVDLSKNELRHARIQNLASAPPNPVAGQFYFDTILDVARVYDGSQWRDMVAASEGTVTSVGGEAPITSTGGTSPTIGITDATTINRGAMSAADKVKLDGIATGATANQADAHLLDRTNHTGSQEISTITGLQSALDGKVDVNTAITGATHTKITYDSKGLVTAGTDLAASDVPNLDAGKITTGSFSVERGGTGLSTVTAGNFLVGAGINPLTERTPAQVLSDIGAASASHSHAIADVTGLQGELDALSGDIGNKVETITADAPINVSRITDTVNITIDAATITTAGSMSGADKLKLDGIAAGATANQTDAHLLDRANHTGSQAISTVTGLQSALDNKLETSLKGAVNGLAELDSGGKVPTNQLPAIAITETFVVADLTARDALTPEQGDVAIVLDIGLGESASYIWDGVVWQKLLTPTDGVTAVTGGTGITSTGGTTPEISITNGGVDTLQLADEGVTEAKLSQDVQTKLNASGGGALKYAETIGDGTSTSFPIQHDFNTRDLTVSVYDVSTHEQVEVGVVLTSVNIVTVSFAVAPSASSYRVVVMG